MQQTIDFAKRLKLDYVQFYCDVANFARMVKGFLSWVQGWAGRSQARYGVIPGRPPLFLTCRRHV